MSVTVTASTTKDFRETITKNSIAWDLTGGTVTWCARKPDGTAVEHAATIVSAAGGEVSYVTTTSDLDAAGNWSYRWRVSVSGVTDYTDEVNLLVVPAPPAP